MAQRRSLSPEEMQKLAIPRAEDNPAGKNRGRARKPSEPAERRQPANPREAIIAGLGKDSDIQFGNPNADREVNMDVMKRRVGAKIPAQGGREPDVDLFQDAEEEWEEDEYEEIEAEAENADDDYDFPPPAIHGSPEDFDPLGGPDQHYVYERRVKETVNPPPRAKRKAPPMPPPCPHCRMVKVQETLTVEMDSGTFMVPAHDVRESAMGVVAITPSNGLSFIPRAGTKLTLTYKGKSWLCYFPGSYASYPELGYNVLSFLKEE